jgi:hypothetical protein
MAHVDKVVCTPIIDIGVATDIDIDASFNKPLMQNRFRRFLKVYRPELLGHCEYP